jgi:NADH oxidase (H2O2-forming)
LPHYLGGEISRRNLFLRTRKDYVREKIKTILGQRVTGISPGDKKLFLDAGSLSYDKLIMATGSHPIILPIPGANLDGVFPLKSLADADRISGYASHTAVVIGSGPVGVETSIALRKRGQQVYLIEVVDRIMPRVFDETPSSLLRSIIEEQGVNILAGEKVTNIVGRGKVAGVVTDKRQIKCDLVILGSGMRPNIELAKQSGIKISALGGISVNDRMMTDIDDIYACGDCVETRNEVTGEPTLCLLWHNAKRQGEVAGYNCCGIPRSYSGSQNITSLDIFGTHVVSFGQLAAEVGQHDGAGIIEGNIGKNYYRLVIADTRLAGVQSIGDIPALGALLSTLTRQDDLSKIRQAIAAGIMPPDHWYRRAASYLADHSSTGRTRLRGEGSTLTACNEKDRI